MERWCHAAGGSWGILAEVIGIRAVFGLGAAVALLAAVVAVVLFRGANDAALAPAPSSGRPAGPATPATST